MAQTQFESAANLNVNLDVSPQLAAEFGVEIAMPTSKMGFKGDQTVGISGISIAYTPTDFYNTSVSVGLLTVPFGQFIDSQTSHSSVNSSFIINDLGYVFIAKGSNINTFSSGGLQTTTDLPNAIGTLDVMVFNGSDDLATNDDHGFGTAVRLTNESIIKNVQLGVSFLNINDLEATRQTESGRFNANTAAGMLDIKIALNTMELGGYVSFFNIDDSNASTKDNLNVFMGYIVKPITDKLTLAGRYSFLRAEDYDGSGDGVSEGIDPSFIGFGLVGVSDVDLARAQLALIVDLDEGVVLHNELTYDVYGEGRNDFNQLVALSYANITF